MLLLIVDVLASINKYKEMFYFKSCIRYLSSWGIELISAAKWNNRAEPNLAPIGPELAPMGVGGR